MKPKGLISSTLNSYSVIFFSDKIIFALILLLVSFFDIFSGLCGLVAVITTNLAAEFLGFDKFKVQKGFYGFNSLLLGVGIGLHMEMSWIVVLLIMIASIMTLFALITLERIFDKYYVPYLSLPLLLSFWIISLASREIPLLALSTRDIYFVNYVYGLGGEKVVDIYRWWNTLGISNSLKIYFLSLAGIFFQQKLLSGVVIAVGLFYYSRIGFSLSLLGFYTAYFFYQLIGINVTYLPFADIGINFILTSIAIGGYFIIPSRSSYIWVMVLIPITTLITYAVHQILAPWGLVVYSLPFNIVVISFLIVIKARIYKTGNLTEVSVQSASPEVNLYNFVNNNHRYKDKVYFSMRLPFFGEWSVSQGHNGEITHKDKWQYAWDFVIRDSDHHTYGREGVSLEDYYCYNKAVLSPSDGVVEEIVDGIPDNPIGDINLESNWGNSIIIKHSDGFYSQISHLKPYSFKVTKGEWVKAGQMIAACGNSGRSPEPHLHFQLQSVPIVGAETVDYPLGYYLKKETKTLSFKSYSKPELHDIVSNLEINSLMKSAFHFLPGQKIKFEVDIKGKRTIVEWEAITDIYNVSYIYCKQSNSYAYYANDDRVFYFYNFVGSKRSLLYYFFLATYKAPLCFYKDLIVEDTIAINHVYTKPGLLIQDFVAPFYIFLKADFNLAYKEKDDEINPSLLTFNSSVTKSFLGMKTEGVKFEIKVSKEGINEITVFLKNKTIRGKCIDQQ